MCVGAKPPPIDIEGAKKFPKKTIVYLSEEGNLIWGLGQHRRVWLPSYIMYAVGEEVGRALQASGYRAGVPSPRLLKSYQTDRHPLDDTPDQPSPTLSPDHR